MPTVTNGDVEIHYEDSGGAGRPVVLIHGWPLSGKSWADLTPLCTDEGYRVVTYDRRGFGQSGKPGEDSSYDYDTLTSDLDALLTQLDLTGRQPCRASPWVAARLRATSGPTVRTACTASSSLPRSRRSCSRTTTTPTVASTARPRTGMQGHLTADREGFFDGFTTNFFSADDELKVTEEQRQEALALAAQADLTPQRHASSPGSPTSPATSPRSPCPPW